MDPLGNQPTQTNPQQPPISPPPSPAPQNPLNAQQQAEVPRPEQITPPVSPPERPVEAWPPAGTAAAQEVLQANDAPGEETPTGPTPPTISEAPVTTQPAPTGSMDGFVAPIPIVEDSKNPTVSNPVDKPMSDQQADSLFQEEPETKEKKSSGKAKKTLIILFSTLVLSLVALGGYIFYFGNKAAQAYVDNSVPTKYREAFSQISSALEQNPVKSAELESGFNKLKVAKDSPNALSPVLLGSLNPNYKKAKEASQAESEYRTKADNYQTKYGDYTTYLSAVSGSLSIVADLEKVSTLDTSTTAAEKITSDLTSLLAKCNSISESLKGATAPSELKEDVSGLQKSIALFCTEASYSLEDGIIAFLNGKTGTLSSTDQLGAKEKTQAFVNLTTNIAKTEAATFNLENITAYQQSALDEAKTLSQ